MGKGSNLYEFGASSPYAMGDPLGLQPGSFATDTLCFAQELEERQIAWRNPWPLLLGQQQPVALILAMAGGSRYSEAAQILIEMGYEVHRYSKVYNSTWPGIKKEIDTYASRIKVVYMFGDVGFKNPGFQMGSGHWWDSRTYYLKPEDFLVGIKADLVIAAGCYSKSKFSNLIASKGVSIGFQGPVNSSTASEFSINLLERLKEGNDLATAIDKANTLNLPKSGDPELNNDNTLVITYK
jgi:hypothetical protein